MISETATLTVPGLLVQVPRIRHWLEGALSGWAVSAETTADLVLAVTEVCTNIIRHGYGGKTKGNIEVHLAKDEDTLRLTLVDQAPAFVPKEVSAPLPEALVEGGYGRFLVHTLVDEVSHQSLGKRGNRLTLVKYDRPPPHKP